MDLIRVLIPVPQGYVRDTFFTPAVKRQMESLTEFRFEWNDTGRFLSHDELAECLSECDACLLNWGCGKLDDALLDRTPKLRFIGILGGAARPYIDESFFDRKDYVDRVLVNSSDIMAQSVAEAVLAYMLCALRHLSYYDSRLKAGMLWREEDFHNSGLFHKTIGLIGLGQVGRNLMRYLKPFSPHFLVYDPYIRQLPSENGDAALTDLDDVLRKSDILSVQAALTAQTRHMIGRRELAMLRDGALIVNTARGGILDEKALADELATGRIRAALDVFEQEPLSRESPLRRMDNVLLIPHMAGPTIDMRQQMTLSLIGHMTCFFKEAIVQNPITKERYRIMT